MVTFYLMGSLLTTIVILIIGIDNLVGALGGFLKGVSKDDLVSVGVLALAPWGSWASLIPLITFLAIHFRSEFKELLRTNISDLVKCLKTAVKRLFK